jgi:hypothetical protein
MLALMQKGDDALNARDFATVDIVQRSGSGRSLANRRIGGATSGDPQAISKA